MESIFNNYVQDLERIKVSIRLLESLDSFAKISTQDIELPNSLFIQESFKLNSTYKDIESRKSTIALPGILMLYVAGRFEHFVRTIFELTSSEMASGFDSFAALPKTFQQNLIVDTSKVIKDPRKYRHGEGARDAFIKNLHRNIHENDLDVINYQCISITERNMKSSELERLFEKINYKNIWNDICSQADIRKFFGGADMAKSKKECTKMLDNFMDLRNNIAHPSDSLTWISKEVAIQNIDFFVLLGEAIKNVCPIHIMNSCPQTPPNNSM